MGVVVWRTLYFSMLWQNRAPSRASHGIYAIVDSSGHEEIAPGSFRKLPPPGSTCARGPLPGFVAFQPPARKTLPFIFSRSGQREVRKVSSGGLVGGGASRGVAFLPAPLAAGPICNRTSWSAPIGSQVEELHESVCVCQSVQAHANLSVDPSPSRLPPPSIVAYSNTPLLPSDPG